MGRRRLENSDTGNRFRLLVNEVETVTQDLPKLPVARALWKPMSDMQTGCAVWILAGGAHHTVYSQSLITEQIDDFAARPALQNRGDIGGITHTHSTYAMAWAQAGMDIPIFGTTHADHTHQDIPCAPTLTDAMIPGDYKHEMGNQIMDMFSRKRLSHSEVEMVLLQNHGPFTWGKTAEKSVYKAAVLEEVARMAYLTLQINPNTARINDSLRLTHHKRKHGNDAYYGQGC